MVNTLPDAFTQTIRDIHGAGGESWLQTLPDTLARYGRAWDVTIAPPFPGLSYNYVAPAVRADGMQAVLKATVPGDDMIVREAIALRWYHGRGCVRLLEADEAHGVLLLERLLPGTQLASLEDDDLATKIAAGVMSELFWPAPPSKLFPTVHDRAANLANLRTTFGGGTGPYPKQLVEMAETLFRDLGESQGPLVLVHADLHHYNILAAGEAWLAIDPQGLIGEAEYEVGALLRNPIHRIPRGENLKRVMARRVDLLSEALGFDRQRIIGWGIAQAVLSAWWSYEDHGDLGETSLRCAEALAGLVS